jgi:hypothetical protein
VVGDHLNYGIVVAPIVGSAAILGAFPTSPRVDRHIVHCVSRKCAPNLHVAQIRRQADHEQGESDFYWSIRHEEVHDESLEPEGVKLK